MQFENFSLSIYLVNGCKNYSDLYPSIERINWYPGRPFLLSSREISSQSIIDTFKFDFINFTKVDFPVAIPPVKPMILTFYSLFPNQYMSMHGRSVERRGVIEQKKVWASTNYIQGDVYIDKEGENEDNYFGVDMKLVSDFDEVDAEEDDSENEDDEIDGKQYSSHHFN